MGHALLFLIRTLRSFSPLLLGVLLALQAWAGQPEIDYWLHLDRFHYYLGELATQVAKKGRDDVAQVLRKVSAPELHRAQIAPEKLADAMGYDELAALALRKLHPELQFTQDELTWSYPFFKRKLGEGFVYKPTEANATSSEGTAPLINTDQNGSRSSLPVPSQATSDFSFDFSHYIAHRTTRGALWYAATHNLKIEFHLGDEREFRHDLEKSGARVLGEIRPMGRNYNKIFLLQYPGEDKPRLAFNRITGMDRLDHLARQVLIEAWEGHYSSAFTHVSVVGDLDNYLKAHEDELYRTLSALPEADRVVIGQMGAIEGLFESAGKFEAVSRLIKKAPAAVRARLGDTAHSKLVSLLEEVRSKGGPFVATKKDKEWEKAYEQLLPDFEAKGISKAEKGTSFRIENDSHDVMDLLFTDAEGKLKRWRIFSNVWGDEIVPIAGALKRVGAKKITYIGTAGAFPNKGLEVGDLVMPSKALNRQDQLLTISPAGLQPSNAITHRTVAHVTTPYEETRDWVRRKEAQADLVEVEVAYLAQVFGPDYPINVALMVSDVLGAEGESLADESSSKRKAALTSVLTALANQDQLTSLGSETAPERSPLEVLTRIRAAQPSRDETSQYQVLQKARDQGITTREQLESLLNSEPSFTKSFLEKRLTETLLDELRAFASEVGIPFKIRPGASFRKGTWNPKSEPMPIELVADHLPQQAVLEAKFVEFLNAANSRRQRYQIATPRGPPPEEYPTISLDDRYGLLASYQRFAFDNAGLFTMTSRTGGQNYTFLPVRTLSRPCDQALRRR